MKRPQVFIEKIMPVKLLNEQVYYEHGGNPFKGLHRWYSRKPLSFSRASVLASLLPADISMEEFEYLLGLHPDKEGINVKKKEAIKLYKTPPSTLVIKKLEEYCDRIWGKRKPVVLDAFKAREFPFDEARQLALAIGGFDVNDLAKTYKLLASKSGSCTILTPKQRHKKRAFTADADNFSNLYLVDALHAIIAIYEEEQNPQLVRNFMQKTGLNNNDMLMKTLEIAFKVIPKSTDEHKTLTSLWLSMDEIKAKVVYEQTKLSL